MGTYADLLIQYHARGGVGTHQAREKLTLIFNTLILIQLHSFIIGFLKNRKTLPSFLYKPKQYIKNKKHISKFISEILVYANQNSHKKFREFRLFWKKRLARMSYRTQGNAGPTNLKLQLKSPCFISGVLQKTLNNNIEMSAKTTKWTPEEDKAVGELRDSQTSKGQVNWEKISNMLNEKYNGAKSAKQCRERYVNYIKFYSRGFQSSQLTEEELNIFMELFLQHGSAWSLISKHINKSENNLKNKFHNFVRKASNVLHDHEIKGCRSKRRSICPSLLIPMIDLTSQLKRIIQSHNLTLNQNSALFKFRDLFIRFSFKTAEFGQEDALNLIRQIKYLNSKLRCFGVFKVKNRKNWKLTMRGMKAICEFDEVILEPFPESNQAEVKAQEPVENKMVQIPVATYPEPIPYQIPQQISIKQEPKQTNIIMMTPWIFPVPINYYEPMFYPQLKQEFDPNICNPIRKF